MLHLDYRDPRPIYEQIRQEFMRLILSGAIAPGEKLPSVRDLAGTLSINPNTIQKAYSELDARGVIYSVPGIGCFVSENAVALLGEYRREKLGALNKLLQDLALAGIAKEEILRCVDQAYPHYREGPPQP